MTGLEIILIGVVVIEAIGLFLYQHRNKVTQYENHVHNQVTALWNELKNLENQLAHKVNTVENALGSELGKVHERIDAVKEVLKNQK